jgi:hypothetical protein
VSSNLAGCASPLNELEDHRADSQRNPSAACPRNSFSESSQPATVYPIVVAEWQRNSREIVRVALDRFNNRETIDIRSWWQDSEGNWRPGRGGLTLAVKHLPALAEGLADALDRARALGLVEPITNTKDRTAAERQRRYRQRRNGGVTP